ncbi:hypothetical protein [Clostera anachoreta granulovirus]|uniref:Uncharacterized protein n=1 Tax=Clostera anachoreta granulovirus TaxID=283675 RepID=F4ZKZ7_9BBAC|nr:hypothetical protein ClanGV_gp120 [Clostera anachoreta granulovirus]AEB00408.1 hypothetical protein [Clostera anachoreta granulovirus]
MTKLPCAHSQEVYAQTTIDVCTGDDSKSILIHAGLFVFIIAFFAILVYIGYVIKAPL